MGIVEEYEDAIAGSPGPGNGRWLIWAVIAAFAILVIAGLIVNGVA